jgi:broad specificity phosphatase PhoE
MHKIMIIRHAEKHQPGSHGKGVTEDGRAAKHELTVRGWQRATALVHFFSAAGAVSKGSAIQPPRSIFASDATKQSPSLRAMHTAGPLSSALGVEVNHDFAEGEEAELAAVARAAPSPVLIVWHHGRISKLARKIADDDIGCPAHWPDERFDVVWILEHGGAHGSGWAFSQVPQCLFPDDCPDVF